MSKISLSLQASKVYSIQWVLYVAQIAYSIIAYFCVWLDLERRPLRYSMFFINLIVNVLYFISALTFSNPYDNATNITPTAETIRSDAETAEIFNCMTIGLTFFLLFLKMNFEKNKISKQDEINGLK